jgi:hypothetical protein
MADRVCYFVRTKEPGSSIDPHARVDSDLLFGEIVKAALKPATPKKPSFLRGDNEHVQIKLFECSRFVSKRIRWMATKLYEYYAPELDSQTLDEFICMEKTIDQIQTFLSERCRKEMLYASFASGLGQDGQVRFVTTKYMDVNSYTKRRLS